MADTPEMRTLEEKIRAMMCNYDALRAASKKILEKYADVFENLKDK
jgi:hypothetical protein